MSGQLVGNSVLARARELLTDDAPHRPAHEREIHHRESAREPLDPGRARDHRVAETGRHLGLGQSLGVGLEVEELERVARPQRGLVLGEGAGVGQLLDPLVPAHGEVMAALRADPEQRLQLVVAIVRPAAGTRVRMLLRRHVVEACLLVLDRDVDLVGGGHLRHLRPGSPADGYRPAAATSRATTTGSASMVSPVNPRPVRERRATIAARIDSASSRSRPPGSGMKTAS